MLMNKIKRSHPLPKPSQLATNKIHSPEQLGVKRSAFVDLPSSRYRRERHPVLRPARINVGGYGIEEGVLVRGGGGGAGAHRKSGRGEGERRRGREEERERRRERGGERER